MLRATCCCLLVLCGYFVAGCWRPYPPVAWVNKTAPIYPASRPHDCRMVMLAEPPVQPYETFAQIWSYGNSTEALIRMQDLIRFEACQLGAHAVLLLPVQEIEHINTIDSYPDWVTGLGLDQGGMRDPHVVAKRYSLTQVGFALIFKPENRTETDNDKTNAVH